MVLGVTILVALKIRAARVLAGVALLVLHSLQQKVEARSQQRSHDGTQPVDPVVVGERAGGDGGAKGTSWVESTASPVAALMPKR